MFISFSLFRSFFSYCVLSLYRFFALRDAVSIGSRFVFAMVFGLIYLSGQLKIAALPLSLSRLELANNASALSMSYVFFKNDSNRIKHK